MFPSIYPADQGDGILRPLTTELTIRGAAFSETPQVGDVMQCDIALVAATSFDTRDGAACAWGLWRFPDIVGVRVAPPYTATYGMVSSTPATINSVVRADIMIVGNTSSLVKNTGAQGARGWHYVPTLGGSSAGGGTVTPLNDGAANTQARKIVAIQTVADGSSVTTLTAFFVGWGFGMQPARAATATDAATIIANLTAADLMV
jgi:hypothetical protein